MGINGLFAFIKKRYPELFITSNMTEFKGEKIAIDTNLFIYKYKSIMGQYNWIDSMIFLISSLKKFGVDPVLVFDGSAPELKYQTREKRKQTMENIRERYSTLQEAVDNYRENGIVCDLLHEVMLKKKKGQLKTFLLSNTDEKIDISFLDSECNKLKNQSLTFDELNIPYFKSILKILNIHFIEADCEGEMLCAKLAIEGKVAAVLSEDSDLIPYGCPIIIKHFDTHTGEITAYRVSDLLMLMGFDMPQLIDFCIMCGTDYNKNIPNVGPVASFNLLEKFKRIEDIKIEGIDTLNYENVRTIFYEMNIKKSDTNIIINHNFTDDLKNNHHTNKMRGLIEQSWNVHGPNLVFTRRK